MEPNEIASAVARGKREILLDIEQGRVPADANGFGQLHDYVDANEYGGLTESFADHDTAFAAAVQEELHQWLQAGRPADEISAEKRNLSEQWSTHQEDPAEDAPTRTILVHLNIEVPAELPLGEFREQDIAREIKGVLEVGATDPETTPWLCHGTTEVALAEEI